MKQIGRTESPTHSINPFDEMNPSIIVKNSEHTLKIQSPSITESNQNSVIALQGHRVIKINQSIPNISV